MENLFWVGFLGALIAGLFAVSQAKKVLSYSEGTDKMKKIAASIRAGANAYLKQQYTTVFKVFIVVFVIRLAVTGDDPYDLLAMGFGYLAAAQAYKWHTTKAVSALLMATLCLAISLGWLWFYALEG